MQSDFRPIYRLDMSPTSWQLLWWLVAKMDKQGYVDGGWQSISARQMGRDRTRVARSAKELYQNDLIQRFVGLRRIRVLTQNFRG